MSEATLRQRLVAEIGDEGQARIAQSEAFARSALERRYLEFAGFRAVHDSPEKQGDFTFVHGAFETSDPNVRELAVGAARALSQIKKAAKVG